MRGIHEVTRETDSASSGWGCLQVHPVPQVSTHPASQSKGHPDLALALGQSCLSCLGLQLNNPNGPPAQSGHSGSPRGVPSTPYLG